MKRTLDEHAARFDELAGTYDDGHGEEYRDCLELVCRYAVPGTDDTVLDLGTGTGAVALALAPYTGRVVGRDISEGMLAAAREKAAERGVENVEFGDGRFREPNYGGEVDVVVSNFAMHHLSDDEKREALEAVADTGARRFVLGDVMFFGAPDPDEPFYSPEVDDPATVGTLVEAFTDAGFAVTGARRVHDQVGVLVGERIDADDEVRVA